MPPEMWDINGVSCATAARESKSQEVIVRVRGSALHLSLSENYYAANMGPKQARQLAAILLAGADRIAPPVDGSAEYASWDMTPPAKTLPPIPLPQGDGVSIGGYTPPPPSTPAYTQEGPTETQPTVQTHLPVVLAGRE